MLYIESPQNERFKKLVRLATDNKFRRQSKTFVVEGLKEIRAALEYDYKVDALYLDEKYKAAFHEKEFDGIPVTILSHPLFSRLVYREDASYLIAVVREPDLSLARVSLPEAPLVVILEDIEKPGNLGAVLRTCDAVGADAVILSQDLHHFFHPNVIRSSVGTVFSMQIACAPEEEIRRWCDGHHIRVYAAALQTDRFYTELDYRQGTAFVMGSEDKGLKPYWRDAADAVIKIPMSGHNDSLNVSVSTAVLLYEARRQRGFEKKV